MSADLDESTSELHSLEDRLARDGAYWRTTTVTPAAQLRARLEQIAAGEAPPRKDELTMPATQPDVNQSTESSRLTSRTPRPIRPNTWVAVALVLAVVVISGLFFGFRSQQSSPTVGTKPTSQPTATKQPTPTPVPPNIVTQEDAQGLFNGFLPACQDPSTYSIAGQGVPCPKLRRGRIPPITAATGTTHYCVNDWHLVSSLLIDTKANLQKFRPQMTIDGVSLAVTTTPIKLIDPTFSQKQYGGQYYYTQTGTILAPSQIPVGNHSLHQFDTSGFDRTFAFIIDASGTGSCL